jgi:alpha-D-ribose 1-methylphosphonate 5-triphosphate synthase subunit PhnH
MSTTSTLSAGFDDAVHQSQQAFSAALQALSRPGQPLALGAPIDGVNLQPAMAYLLLTLTDDDTPVWWQHPDPQTEQWLRFHTSAPVTLASGDASFAVLTDLATLPALDCFSAGSAVSPELSTTLLIEVASFDTGPWLQWSGPGLREPIEVQVAGLPDSFWSQWRDNSAGFPQGVDVIFCCAGQVMGLPRTTRVQTIQGS